MTKDRAYLGGLLMAVLFLLLIYVMLWEHNQRRCKNGCMQTKAYPTYEQCEWACRYQGNLR